MQEAETIAAQDPMIFAYFECQIEQAESDLHAATRRVEATGAMGAIAILGLTPTYSASVSVAALPLTEAIAQVAFEAELAAKELKEKIWKATDPLIDFAGGICSEESTLFVCRLRALQHGAEQLVDSAVAQKLLLSDQGHTYRLSAEGRKAQQNALCVFVHKVVSAAVADTRGVDLNGRY